MRKFLIAVLLSAATATPALAQDQNDSHARWHRGQQQNDGDGGHHDQAARGEARPQHSDGGYARPQEPQAVHQPPVIVQQGSRFEGRGNVAPGSDGQVQPYRRYGGGFAGHFDGRGNVAPQVTSPQQSYGGYRGRVDGQPEQARQWNGDRRNWQGQSGSWNGSNSYYGRQQVTRPQVRDGRQWSSGGWSPNWRTDRRYDWRRYRDEHRSIFRVGIYYDPFGYGYQPFEIGYRLMPAYFGQQYWISDPWDYQLPPPPPGSVWVRYWNDALLVDMYSGEVVDVIHGFFW